MPRGPLAGAGSSLSQLNGQGRSLAQPVKWALHQNPWHWVLSDLSVVSPRAKQNLQLVFPKGVK